MNKNRLLVFLFIILIISSTLYYIHAFSEKGYFALTGDGLFMTSFVTKVMNKMYFRDYFYKDKPFSYPPGYFWITGIMGKLSRMTSIGCGIICSLRPVKIGSFPTLVIWWATTRFMTLSDRIGPILPRPFTIVVAKAPCPCWKNWPEMSQVGAAVQSNSLSCWAGLRI